MTKIFNLSLILGFLSVAFMVQAEEMTLKQALELGLKKNPTIKEERQKVEAVRAQMISVKKLPDPEIELEIGGLEEGSSSIDSVSVRQSFDVLPSRISQNQAAKAKLAAAEARYQRVLGEVKREVKLTFTRVMVAEKELETAQANLNAIQQFFSLVQTRFQTGSVLRSDLIRAKIEVLRVQRELLRDEKEIKLNKARLNFLIGQNVLDPIEIIGELKPFDLSYKIDSLLERAKHSRSDLKEKISEVKASKKILQSERFKTFLPRAGFGIEKTREDFEDDTSFLLHLSYPLWSLNRGKTKEAKALLRQNEIQLQSTQDQVQFDVYSSILEMQLAEQDLRLQEQSLQEANELMRQSLVQYQEGEISFLKYLENLAAIRETRLSYFRSLAAVHEKVADLELAIGEEIKTKE